MPWGRLDDTLYDHPKLDLLGKDRLAGMGLWLLCISWSNRHLTDGLIPRERILRLGGTVRLADALVVAGLFDASVEAYLIHDFLSFNRSRKEVEADRRSSRERMAERRANTSRTPGEVPPPARVSRPVPSSPVHSVPDARRVIDPQKQTDEEYRAGLEEAQRRRGLTA